jgi:hypothetical protein
MLLLMAAMSVGQASCGRLGYEEHTRTRHPDAGAHPDDDAGDQDRD